MIYLDNAATSIRKPQEVIDSIIRALNTMGNSSRSVHESSLSAARTVYAAREKIASFFSCETDHVVFCSNSTEALNTVINGTIKHGEHVISTDLEHNSVLRPLHRLKEERDVSLSFVPVGASCRVDYASFENLIQENTVAIICNHASNFTGDMLELKRIGNICRKNDILFIVDASQTAGCFPIDMKDMQIDVLCFTGHKGLLGPQGTGGLCISSGVEILPLKVGGSGTNSYSMSQPQEYPTRLEAGTLNAHGVAGLSAALDYINEIGIDRIRQHEHSLMQLFHSGVKNTPGVKVYGDFTTERAAIVALNIRDYDSALISDHLIQTYGIATRSGAHCAPRMHQALGTDKQGAVRFSFGWYNTANEVECAITAVNEIASST